MTTVCLVMPAWNESEGIAQFLTELDSPVSPWPHTFIVVDDASGDETGLAARRALNTEGRVQVLTNDRNRGHGPSTMRALRAGLEHGADIVVAMDGDGQFVGADVAKVITMLVNSDLELIEGIRTSRDDPGYRKFVSFSTRLLVWTRAHGWPADANTPLRAYRREALSRIVQHLPDESMTPNLLISVMTRRGGFRFGEIVVQARPRLGASTVGTTWGKGSRLPSSRFVKFCTSAIGEWFRTPVR